MLHFFLSSFYLLCHKLTQKAWVSADARPDEEVLFLPHGRWIIAAHFASFGNCMCHWTHITWPHYHSVRVVPGLMKVSGTRSCRAWSATCLHLPSWRLGQSLDVLCRSWPFPTWTFCLRRTRIFIFSVGVSDYPNNFHSPLLDWKTQTNISRSRHEEPNAFQRH